MYNLRQNMEEPVAHSV